MCYIHTVEYYSDFKKSEYFQMLQYSTYEVSKLVIVSRKYNVVCQGLAGEIGSYCSMGIEFQLR